MHTAQIKKKINKGKKNKVENNYQFCGDLKVELALASVFSHSENKIHKIVTIYLNLLELNPENGIVHCQMAKCYLQIVYMKYLVKEDHLVYLDMAEMYNADVFTNAVIE